MKAQAKKKQGKSSRLHKWVLACVLVLVIIGLPILLVMPGSTKPIREVADRFQPPSSWELVRENIEPPRLFCLGVDCNELSREWRISEPITLTELHEIVQPTGWSYEHSGDCETLGVSEKDDGREFLCTITFHGEGTYQGYVYVTFRGDQYLLSLDLWG